METWATITVAAVAALVAVVGIIAVRKLRSLGMLRISGPLGTRVELTAAAHDDTVTVLSLAKRLGELDERVKALESERVLDRATIDRLEAELQETRRRLATSLNERTKLASRVRELEAHVKRLELALAAARGGA